MVFTSGFVLLCSFRSSNYSGSKKIYASHSQVQKSTKDTIIISGRVINKAGEPLAGAEIFFNYLMVTKTDTSGSFSFTPELNPSVKSYVLRFSYAGFVPENRNYNTVMGSTTYTVKLLPPKKFNQESSESTGIRDFFFTEFKLDYPPQEMNDDYRAQLATASQKIKNSPGVIINMCTSGKNEKEIKNAKELLKAMKSYFVEKEGISSDRLIPKIVPYTIEYEKKVILKAAE